MVSRGRLRTHTFIEKSRARSSRCCGQPFVGRLGNMGVDINWDASPVSSPATVLIRCGEVNKVKVKVSSVTWSYLCWIAWLVFQGVTNTATSEPSLHVLSKLTVFSNVSLVDPSQAAGECYCFCVSWHSCFFFLFLCNFLSIYLTKRLQLPELMS